MSARRFDFTGPDHPENDLSTDADFANIPRPEPADFDELADEPDPAETAARNRASTKQAVWFSVIIVVLSFVIALGLVFIFRAMGGPLCDPGPNTWFCSPQQQLTWVIGASIVPIVGMLGSGWMLIRKLRNYLRWRPWMGAFWLLTPHCMFWMLQTLLELSNYLNA
ncbi:hypothetical protein ACG98H_07300 [Corynebacterium sp. L4756]|uniref:hypothetical protein n=1 Tax=unclassified Corynebacterium TaxID=2624378 RepID=UPI00374D78BD